jgi:hypothetical protein
MTKLDASSYIVVAIGILVPVAYALFVIFLTRRGREFSKMDGLSEAMTGLQTALHSAFVKQEQEKTAPKPPADKKT